MKTYNCKNIYEAIKLLEGWIDYLEKANSKDLGDMTPEGKRRNAGYNNYTLYAKWYKEYTAENYQGQPYCATGTSMAFVMAYGLETAKKLLGGDLYYNCEEFYQRMKKEHPERLHSEAKAGDVILFYNGSRHYHTGKVIRELEGGFVTIEENTTSGNNVVVANGGATTRKSYTYDKVNAVFYRPPYDECGISTEDPSMEITKYPINTQTMFGIIIQASSLNVRELPTTDSKAVGSLKYGDSVRPTYKTFDNRGVRWYYIPEKNGWISGNYVKGWIQEENGRWWYALNGGGWTSGDVCVIDGVAYAFDDGGYMITEPVMVYPDASGALHTEQRNQ